MRPTVRLGQVSGINIGLHWSIALIAFILTSSLAGTILPQFAQNYGGGLYLVAALITSALFLASIVAHELGHSLVALRNDIKVTGITLFALGGVASLDGEAANPGVAARVALAGPGVSIGIGAASLAAAVGLNALGLSHLVVVCLVWLGVINVSLALFNLLPALPLDGGRVLQAFLWHRRGNQYDATISAATVGRWIGAGLILVGFWELTQGGNGLWTALIGWFVIVTAKGEARRAQIQRQRERQPESPFTSPLMGPFPGPIAGGYRGGPFSGWIPPNRPGGYYHDQPFGGWPPPRPEDRQGPDDVIDVDGRPVDTRN